MKLLKTVIFFFFLFSPCFLKAQQLVLPGDHPDPSVVKIGDSFWATATTSNWFPAFPVYQSKDLKHWTKKSVVFKQRPEWADYYFWAPEITYDNGKVYIYYTAHKKNGNLCIGAAVADRPDGEYTDLGPLMCQEDGSIDAFPMRDKNGKLYMIWKEDGNSVRKPTPIWAMEMKEDRTGLIGEKKELFRGDQPWENGLVEGVSMVRHGEYYYAVYAAAACCGTKCNYGTGVARSKDLLGPWEKYAQNPVLASTAEWTCPGHGTVVQKDGKYYFLYHGYSAAESVFAGRQGLLQELEFTKDGWISFKKDAPVAVKRTTKSDNFSGSELGLDWQWSIFKDVKYQLAGGVLTLDALPDISGAYIAQPVLYNSYTAETVLTSASAAEAGIGIIGDDKHLVYAAVKGTDIVLKSVRNGEVTVLKTLPGVATQFPLRFRLEASRNASFTFYYAPGKGAYRKISAEAADGSFLPPWDRALRVGMIAIGEKDKKASFDSFTLK